MKLSAVISTAIAAKRENFTTNLRRWKKIKEDESAVLINICEDLAPYIPERLKKPYDKIKVADRLEAAEVLATVFPEEERTRTLIRKIENWLREFWHCIVGEKDAEFTVDEVFAHRWRGPANCKDNNCTFYYMGYKGHRNAEWVMWTGNENCALILAYNAHEKVFPTVPPKRSREQPRNRTQPAVVEGAAPGVNIHVAGGAVAGRKRGRNAAAAVPNDEEQRIVRQRAEEPAAAIVRRENEAAAAQLQAAINGIQGIALDLAVIPPVGPVVQEAAVVAPAAPVQTPLLDSFKRNEDHSAQTTSNNVRQKLRFSICEETREGGRAEWFTFIGFPSPDQISQLRQEFVLKPNGNRYAKVALYFEAPRLITDCAARIEFARTQFCKATGYTGVRDRILVAGLFFADDLYLYVTVQGVLF